MIELYALGAAVAFCFGVYVTRFALKDEPDLAERVCGGVGGVMLSVVFAVLWPPLVACLVLLYAVGVIRRSDLENKGKKNDC